MTNYREEQINEIEALESIYPGELEILAVEPYHEFQISMKSEEYEQDTGEGVHCMLKFMYTPVYPDEPPQLEITEEENLQDRDIEMLTTHLLEQAADSLGMVMVFTMISAAQDWLNSRWDEMKKEKERAAEQKKRELEEAERHKFDGTRVTVETFLAWKRRFDEEMLACKSREKEEKEVKGKLTGKEQFMIDNTLNESDLRFLQDGEEIVKVDESLFQDLDDLDLEDDLEEEEENS